jgi:D-3-phosphoglycerate dehydrogenase
MEILVAETFPNAGLEALKASSAGVEYAPKLKPEELAKALAGKDVLIVRGRSVDGPTLRASPKLKVVIRAGAGLNAIDVNTASELGIAVANTPGKNAVAVAELVFGLLLAIDREITVSTSELKQGVWAKGSHGGSWGLHGRTLGIVGLGYTGQEVAVRAKAFGMKLVGWSRTDKGSDLGIERLELQEVFRRSDAISLHLALARETKQIVNDALLRSMKPKAILINTARAELIEEAPLRDAVAEGRIRLGTDVFHHEPEGGSGAFEDSIGRLPGVVGTHHLGASTEQAQDAVAEEVIHIVKTYLASGDVPHCVNVAQRTR